MEKQLETIFEALYKEFGDSPKIDELYEEVEALWEKNQEKDARIDELEEEVDGLESTPTTGEDVANWYEALKSKEQDKFWDSMDVDEKLEKFVHEYWKEEQFQEGFNYLKYPSWQEGPNCTHHDQLEEYITKNGVSETLQKLTT